jgi:Zn-dependent peptidase ImmA (M78 family)
MTVSSRYRPLKEANKITQMLDGVFGEDRFDKGPVDIVALALEYSRATAGQTPIHTVEAKRLDGCVGALVCGQQRPRQWGILYDERHSPGRKAFTVGHEFGHWVLHRELIEDDPAYSDGIYCDEDSVLRRNGSGIEKEADEFAATVLMPFHDFRHQLPADQRPDFDILSKLAKRYGVSLTAAILRWLEYTKTRALMVVSNEGYAQWARSSDAALKSGRFIRTKNVVYELPKASAAARRDYSDASRTGVLQAANTWFPEAAFEMCLRSDSYDLEITLLHFERMPPSFEDQAGERDAFDQFVATGQR